MTTQTSCRIIDDGTAIALQLDDGSSARYHALWLRDNADDPANFDPVSGQRLHSVAELDPLITVRQASVEANGLSLVFSDGRESAASFTFLRQHNYCAPRQRERHLPERTPWTATLRPDSLISDFDSVSTDDSARLRWLEELARLGVARLRNVPIRSGAVIEAAELFGYIRETNYGRLFEVRARPDAENLAFTALGLDPHTDNPYREPVPTMQLLHCLENDTEGGESVVVDGLAAAHALRDASPRDFELLKTWPMTFGYHGDGISDLVASHVLIGTDREDNVTAIRLNNRSMNPPTSVPYELVPDFYRAYANFVEITRDPAMQVVFRQQPGDMFIVDNTRVMHGRRGFTANGKRWLQGAYADLDGLFSTIRVLRKRLSTTP